MECLLEFLVNQHLQGELLDEWFLDGEDVVLVGAIALAEELAELAEGRHKLGTGDWLWCA